MHKFKKTGANVLFGAEHFCWPDQTLEHVYPEVAKHLPRFLNSGLFIGYAPEINELLAEPIKNSADDQLYYTKAFLDDELRAKLNIKLDYKSEVFQNLNGANGRSSAGGSYNQIKIKRYYFLADNLRLEYNEATGEYFVKNIFTESLPSIFHGNGPGKNLINNYGNYIAGAFKHKECQLCTEVQLPVFEDPSALPTVTIGIFVEKPTPFLEEFLQSILALEYPKNKISLFVHNAVSWWIAMDLGPSLTYANSISGTIPSRSSL